MKKKLRWVLLCGLLLGSSALVSNHFAQQGPGDPNPIAWSHRDIGSVTQAGTFSQTGPVAVIAGSGSDIWGTVDAFHFAYVPWTGDGEFVARINTLDKTHPWAKAGIMLRAGLNEGSAHAMVAVAPEKGVTFLRRLTSGGPTRDDAYQAMRVLNVGGDVTFQRRSSSFYDATTDGPTFGALPRWLRLVRRGNTVQAFDSPEGQNWGWVGTENISLPQPVFVGLAVCSHDDSRVASAQFDGVRLQPGVPANATAPIVGQGDGLQGNYYNGLALSGTPVKRVDAVVNFTWDRQAPVEGIGQEHFRVRWEGDLQAQFSEPYAFHVISDDRARLWINGRLLIDEWENHPETESTALVRLEAGKKYFLRLDYFQDRGKAVAKLLWSSPSTPKQPIPQTQLYSHPQDSDGDGIPDSWELANGLNPLDPSDASKSAGANGLTWQQVFAQGLEPWKATQNTAGLPAGWTDMDIGFVGQAGNARLQGSSLVVSGAGADVWGRADGLHFAYQTLTGDGELEAKVGSVDNTDPWAKAGLMIRGDLEDGSINAFVARTPGHGATFQYRTAAGEGTVAATGGAVGDLCWLKLRRQGNTVSAWQSDDRLNWQWIGTASLSVPQAVYVGPAVTSHDNSRLASAQFDEISVGQVPALATPEAGTGDGLLGAYRDWTSGATVTRLDQTIDFDWGLGQPAEGLGATNFSVAWDGILQAQFDEPHTLHLVSDDGARLWLNDQKLIDAWYDHAAVESTGRVNLQAGRYYQVRVEYYQRTGEAAAKLLWSSPSTPKQPIPQTQLYSPQNPAYALLLQQAISLAQPPQTAGGSTSTNNGGAAPGATAFDTNALPAGVTNVVTVTEVPGAAFIGSLGRWSAEGTSAYSQDGRGYVEYRVNAPMDDIYQLQVQGGARNTRGADFAFPLVLSVDGESVGRFTLNASADQSPASVQQLTPWLKAGPHVVRVFLDNAAKYVPTLRIEAVRLQRLDGPDANGNGVKDWVEAMLHAQCGIEVTPATSRVSPVCLEGRGGFLSMMQASGGIQPQGGAGQRWYANVPLSASRQTTVTVSFQNGGLQETRQVQWQPTDLLQADNLSIRQGDTLLFTVGQNAATVTVAGLTNCTVAAGQSAACRFPAAGTYTVIGAGTTSDGTPANRSVTVTVVNPGLGDSPAAWMQKSRVWNCPALPAGTVLENDPRLELIDLTNTSAAAPGYGLKIDAQEPRYLLARSGAAGPVAANLRVDGFRLFAASDTYVDAIHTFADGSTMIESGLVLSPVLPQVTVRLEIVVGGVTFDDGTLVKELGPGDFNELGQASVRFLRPADVQTSVCHMIKAYQNGVLLGVH
jgi:regulation of enolase protein 1 (concanavalin A-like superfamily)